MNKERREELIEAAEFLSDAIDIIQQVRDEEEEAYDDLPEGLQNGRTGASMEEAMNKLDAFIDSISKTANDVDLFIKNKKKNKK